MHVTAKKRRHLLKFMIKIFITQYFHFLKSFMWSFPEIYYKYNWKLFQLLDARMEVFLNFRCKFYKSFFFLIITQNFSFSRLFGVNLLTFITWCMCMTWPQISESTFPSKISPHILWKTAQLSKMLCNNDPLRVQ